MSRFKLLCSAASIVGAASPALADIYAVQFNSPNLYRINEVTGQSELVAPLSDQNLAMGGLDFDGAGRLFGTDTFRFGGGATRKLWEINFNTAALTPLKDFATTDVFFEGGFSVDRTTNIAYFSEEEDFYQTDLNTLTFTPKGKLTFNGSPLADPNLDGLAFRGGDLYGIISNQSGVGLDGHLVRINKLTNAVTDVGPTGLTTQSTAGLTYDPDRDVFYLASSNLPGLYRVDPNTGVATLIGNHDISGISGMAFIPEPTALLSAAGALVMLRRKRAR